MKINHGRTHELLIPLPISKGPWEEIPTDSITNFPTTSVHNDMIWTIVDRFSKIAHFIPCIKTDDATNITNLFFKEIVRLHGIPKSIVTDKDTKFLSHF